jgi:hypothetical protein
MNDDLMGKNINLGVSPQNNENKVNPLNDIEEDLKDLKDLNHPDTLDEPVYDTLKRDFVKIVHKIQQVLFPKTTADQTKSLRNCKRIL